MDPITQGALGAIAAAAFSPSKGVRVATLIGWAGGMLADADALIRSAADPLLTIDYHRHFSHSLIFIPLGALVCSAFIWALFRKWLSFREIYVYSFLGYATAGLLDSCTSYATLLLWPFSEARIAWNIISIIDPVFTGSILALIAIGFVTRKAGSSRIACFFAIAYLLFGVAQNRQATRALTALAESRGHDTAERFTVKPSIGNLALWRAIYEFEDQYYVDAIRVDYFGSGTRVYAGETTSKVDLAAVKAKIPADSILSRDLDRFASFSDAYLCWHPNQGNVLGDARYAVLPNSATPLWGIEVDASKVNEHVRFVNFRKADKESVARLWEMIMGAER